MIYARGMPSLTPDLRLERLQPLNFDQVRLTPGEAAERGERQSPPGSAILLTVMGRPAYRFGGKEPRTIFADTGELLREIGPSGARGVAAQFLGVTPWQVRYLGLLTEADQWTISLRGRLPLHMLSVDDGRGTRVYVSPRSAEVAQLTTRGGRALAWIAAIPHWLYFTPLRVRDGLWRHIVLWASGLGSALAVLGITAGLQRWRGKCSGGRRSPASEAGER